MWQARRSRLRATALLAAISALVVADIPSPDPAREYLPPDLGVPCFIFVMLSGCIYVYGVFSLQRLQKDCVRNYVSPLNPTQPTSPSSSYYALSHTLYILFLSFSMGQIRDTSLAYPAISSRPSRASFMGDLKIMRVRVSRPPTCSLSLAPGIPRETGAKRISTKDR